MHLDLLDLSQPLLWTVERLLAPEECRALVGRIDAAGCEPAPVTNARGSEMRPDIRNNERAMIRDFDLARALFERARRHLPVGLRGMTLVGLNELFRGYRYRPGQRFALHHDGTFVRNEREQSLLTFMIYLNDDFTGGETDFPELGRTIVPATGSALVFQHSVLHEGCAVTGGIKYVLRSDVMYAETSSVAAAC